MAQFNGPSAKASHGIVGALLLLSLGGCEAIYDDTKGWANRLEASLLEAAHELSEDPDAEEPANYTPEVVEPAGPPRPAEGPSMALRGGATPKTPVRKPDGLVAGAAETLLTSDPETGTAKPAKTTAEVEATKSKDEMATASVPPLPTPKPQTAEMPQEQKPAQDNAPGQPAQAAADVAMVLHLSSLRSEEAAKREWSELKRSFPEPLGALEAEIRRTELGNKGTFYRVLAGPLPSRGAAKDACAAVKATNVKQYCRILPSEPAAKAPS